jgi:hypothetical protein
VPIPDRIERTIDLAQPPQRVWEALTSVEWDDESHKAMLTVVESGFAQVPDELLDTAYHSHVEGWRNELAELVGYLHAAA